MIKSKKALLKKEFDLFSSLPGEDTKKLIERYCHLVRSMSMLGVTKDREEWVDKLADALPQKEWGTYLMILKNTGVYDDLTISQFIEKIESQDLEQQKIARMNSPSGQQDVKMYYKGSIPVLESERSPKIQTAFSAGESTEKADQGSSKISNGFSSFPSVNPKESNTSFQSQSTKTGNGYVIQCNIALNLPEDQSFSEDTAKDHMALLGSVLLSYEGLVAGRIGNPMLTKEDYDQIDAEEMELMDIKWCLASVLRWAEKFKTITGRNDFLDAHVSTLGFDKSKVTCFRCREKGHFKRECKNREASGAQNPFGKDDYYRKAIYQQEKRAAKEQQKKSEDDVKNVESVAEKIAEDEKVIEAEKVIEVVKTIEVEKIVEVVKPCMKCLEGCKECVAKDDIIAEYEKKKEQLLFNLNYVKESCDVLNKTVTGLQKTNSEREQALTMMNVVMMTKQKAINFYIEESAKWKQELETEKIENERIRRLLQIYSSSDYLIDRIYPTVAGMEAFQDEKPKKKKDCGKKPTVSYNKCLPPIWEGYSPRKPNEEQLEKAVNIKLKTYITDVLPDNIDVTFTSSDTDHESEIIKKVVDQVLDTNEEPESKSGSEWSNSLVNSENSSVKRSYSKDFLLSKASLNDETSEVVYTLNDSDKLYYNKEFPIRSVRFDMIKKVFKMTEINISEIKDLNLSRKPKKYTSRVQQRLNKKKGYNSGSGFQKKPNQNRSYKKKGLGFVPPENYKNDINSKTKTEFVSGGSSEDEQKKPFWRQSNQEFLAERKKNGTEVFYQRETRTCYKCNEVGHIAWNCQKNAKTIQGVSQKLKEKVVNVEPTTNRLKFFENSTYEVGECSKKNFYKKKEKDNQMWLLRRLM
ncbi:putative transcription factor interactor and regulator CCHC(Zn) family [Helianthus annuus]|nr:putative transcription factor interactor and regulator CCHC(Zn) family [Helianthus annuus]